MKRERHLLSILIALCLLQCTSCFVPVQRSGGRPSLSLLRHHSHSDAAPNNELDSLRRSIILTAPATLLLPTNQANAAETTAEAIRLLSSKTIPGLGPPDIYYPPYFVGKWKVARVISTSDDKFWSDMKQKGVSLPIKVISEMRFIPYDAGKDFSGDENPNNVPAIADRTFNEKAYHAALSEELNRLYATTKPILPAIQTLNWTPTNPNVLSLSYADGSSKEVKATKRSSDVSKDGSGIFSSEFRRITDVPSASSGAVAGGIPTVYKSRVLTKWKQASGNNDGGSVNYIEGIEILYNESGTMGERTDILGSNGRNGVMESVYGGDTKDLADWRSTKTKILMERIVG